MQMEHHKEEYEHWSDSEEYQQPCCRRNRRDDFDFSDSEGFTSDAESEDLERLLWKLLIRLKSSNPIKTNCEEITNRSEFQ